MSSSEDYDETAATIMHAEAVRLHTVVRKDTDVSWRV